MELIKHETKERLRREEAARRLREVADELERHNQLPFVEDGVRYSIDVPDEVTFELEIEVKDSKSEIEISLEW